MRKLLFGTISVLLLFSLSLGILTSCGDDEVDFLEDDLSEYVSISESDYKSFPVTNELSEYSEDLLTQKIDKILAEKRGEPQNNGQGVRAVEISLGDTVSIYYRGYTIDKDGKNQEIKSNFLSGATEFVVGEGKFTPYEVEKALIGKTPIDYGKFFRITEGEVSENQVVYISYFSYSESLNKNVVNERLDLSRKDIDDEYGEGFRDFILSSEIGKTLDTKDTFKHGAESVQYQGLIINFATDCEDKPLTVKAVLPNSYEDVSLRGKEIVFDVYIEYAIIYDTAEFDDDFILKTLKVDAKTLDSYKGSSVTEKYKNLLREEIRSEIDETNEYLIIEDMWKHYKKKAEIKLLPEATVERYYNSYYEEVNAAYSQNTANYSNMDEYAIGYLNYNYNIGIPTGGDWRTYLRNFCKTTVTEKLIFYYIIREEGFLPNDAEYDRIYNEILDEHVEYYLSQRKDEIATLDKDAYAAYVQDLRVEVHDEIYGEEYFREQTYYSYGAKKLVSFAKMS